MLLHILRINLQLSLARCELLWRQRMDLQLCNKFYGCRSIVVMSLAHFSRGNGGFRKMFCSLNGILIASENFVDLHSQQLILFIILLPDSRFPFACLYMGMHTNIYTLDRLTTSTAIETCDKLQTGIRMQSIFFFLTMLLLGVSLTRTRWTCCLFLSAATQQLSCLRYFFVVLCLLVCGLQHVVFMCNLLSKFNSKMEFY